MTTAFLRNVRRSCEIRVCIVSVRYFCRTGEEHIFYLRIQIDTSCVGKLRRARVFGKGLGGRRMAGVAGSSRTSVFARSLTNSRISKVDCPSPSRFFFVMPSSSISTKIFLDNNASLRIFLMLSRSHGSFLFVSVKRCL